MRPNLHPDAVLCQGTRMAGGTPDGLSARDLRRHSAKATVARLEHAQRHAQLVLTELWPHRLREVQLGVCALPEHEIAQPLLAARTNEQVDIADRPGIMV